MPDSEEDIEELVDGGNSGIVISSALYETFLCTTIRAYKIS